MRTYATFRPKRRSFVALPILALLAPLAGCASGGPGNSSIEDNANDPGQLIAAGAQVYGNNCARCHNARAAAEKTDLQWDIVVAHMRARANLTGAQARAVQAFLSMVNAPPTGGDAELPQTPPETVDSPQEGPSPTVDLPASNPPEPSFPRHSGPFAFEDQLRPYPGQRAPNPQEAPDSLVGIGRSLAGAKGCIGCHVLEEKGGSIGPSLDDLFDRRDDEFVREKLRDPRTDNPNSVMPNYAMTDEEIDAFVAYLGSLAG